MLKLRRLVLFFCFASLPVLAQIATPAAKLSHFDPLQADVALDPCQDFYKYACSRWFTANPMPADQVYWGTGSGLVLWNQSVLRETLQSAAEATGQRTPVQQQVGDYWAACMDEKGQDAAGSRDLQSLLKRIHAVRGKGELIEAIALLHQTYPGAWQSDDNQADAPFFGFGPTQDFDDASLVVSGIDQGGMSLPGRDFYLKDDAKSAELRTKYQAHIARMFELIGEKPEAASSHAAAVLAIETDFAKAAMDNVSRRDPKNLNHKMSLAEAQALAPTLNLKRYIEIIGAPPTKHYLVTSPAFFRAVEKMLQAHPLEHWIAYLDWQAAHYGAPYLSKAFVDENWDFFAHTLAGARKQRPRWRRCVAAADRDLGDVLGQAYVERAFPPESKQRMLELVKNIENALDRDIQSLDWMSDATKKQAAVKLSSIEDKIGYPNKWHDFSSVKITRTSYLQNVAQATNFEFHRQLQKVGRPVDRIDWSMTPPTVNAYYDAQLNTINFPAGILQPPYFDKESDAAVNYGAIGAVIGHEITHGFDDQGRKFDAKGNLRDWWTAEDAKAYDERGKCIVDQYTQEVPEAGVKQDGNLTLGEDTADNGGIRIALSALEEVLKKEGKSLDDKGPDGWTNRQRFFLSYANAWCTEARPEVMRIQVLSNPHSFSRYRVNNVVANQPEFGEAFRCKKGSPMVRENACRVW
jgi:endothelin-converting enzyme/putative endopeptidase